MADVNTELVIFFRSLATLQGAGIHVLRSLEVLSRQLDNPQVKTALEDTLRQVNSGVPLSKALSRHPKLFKPLHLQMLRVGENSGGLHRVLENLAVHAEKSYALLDENKYTFVVSPDANKTQIKIAVEQVFGVKVTSVNTLNREGKRLRTRTGFGRRAATKRAIVTVAAGDRIDIFGGPVS